MVALSTLPGAHRRPLARVFRFPRHGQPPRPDSPMDGPRCGRITRLLRLFPALVGISASWPHAVHSIFTKSASPA
jgi:hypothetical protein